MKIIKIPLLPELIPLKPFEPRSLPQATLDVSLIIPAKNSQHTLAKTVQEAHEFLSKHYPKPNSFEIILVPNPSPHDSKDLSTQVSLELEKKYSNIRVCPHFAPRGKGAAIRTGFQASRGKWIFFTDADLPYDLSFFEEAAKKLKQGYHLINGNRRLPTSQFSIPVTLLKIAYGRHRLGVWFNRMVRMLLPITTTDTQAGIKALSRQLATETFSRQSCPGFLFDLEIFLTAAAQGLLQTELPVTLYLNSEKSTVRILRECLLVATWLGRIKVRQMNSVYGKKRNRRILRRFKKISPLTRFFLTARWWLTPYSTMASKLPLAGDILDLGCGHGLFSITAALHSPSRNILGLDHDPKRILIAASATHELENVQVVSGNLLSPPKREKSYSGVAMIDVMHYFDPESQKLLLKNAFEILNPGGTLIIREVEPGGGIISRWNRAYERLATQIGFTRSEQKDLHFRTRNHWEELMRTAGFKVTSEPCSSFLFADILYVCERPL